MPDQVKHDFCIWLASCFWRPLYVDKVSEIHDGKLGSLE